MEEGAGAVDGLEWVQRQAMKMIKGREGLIYKTRLEELGCRAWLRDGSQAVGVSQEGGWEGYGSLVTQRGLLVSTACQDDLKDP